MADLLQEEVELMKEAEVWRDWMALGARAGVVVGVLLAMWALVELVKFLLGKGNLLRVVLLPVLVSGYFVAFFTVVPPNIDASLNTVHALGPVLDLQGEFADDLAFYNSLDFVADLHADALLWKRDILHRASHGHVDVPRLIEGNVALQGFTIVTSVPNGMNMFENKRPTVLSDPVTLLAVSQLWPFDTITSLSSRTLAQISKLQQAASDSNGTLRVIRWKEDLEELIKVRLDGRKTVGGYLGIEGLQALDGKKENVKVFFDAGVRTFGLAHFFDNEVAGSAHGEERAGLTALGREVVKELEELSVFVDIAHSSPATIDDVCAIATKPVISSHTGARGLCNSPRNLEDKHIRCVAATGGILGVAYFRPTICGIDEVSGIVASMRYIADLVGVEHVALGSDFDGSVSTPFDTTGLAQLVVRMREANFSDDDIRLIMGDNVKNLFLQHLPSEH